MCTQKFTGQINKSSISCPPSKTCRFLISTTYRNGSIKERFHVVVPLQEMLVFHVADLVLPSKHEYLRSIEYFLYRMFQILDLQLLEFLAIQNHKLANSVPN